MDKLSEEIGIGSGVTTIMIITLFLLVVGIGIIMLVLLYQKKQLQYLKDKEKLKGAYDKEILESKLEIQEQTMKNISQEIHDNIGQVLSLVKLNINSMDCNDPPSLQKKIQNSSQLVGKAIQDLRELAKSLHTDAIIEMGLLKSIVYELDMIKKSGNYQTCLDQQGDSINLSQQQELILFRIFQEVLNNIMKHAKASSIVVEVFNNANNFILKITDDGDGFDVAGVMENKPVGLGIKNIRNRAGLIGATYNIISKPGKGTTVTLELPANKHSGLV